MTVTCAIQYTFGLQDRIRTEHVSLMYLARKNLVGVRTRTCMRDVDQLKLCVPDVYVVWSS